LASEDRVKKWIEEQDERIGFNVFDNTLKYNLYTIHELLRKQYDVFICIDGREGHGKTTIGANIGSFVDPGFTEKRIYFTTEAFLKGLKEAPPYTAHQLDEAGLMLMSRESMKSMNTFLIKTFMIMRQKYLCVILCLPSFFMIDNYIRDHRTDCLIHLYSRGKYGFYNRDRVKSLSIKASKYKNHNAIFPSFKGYFNKDWAKQVSREAYDKMKSDHMNVFIDSIDSSDPLHLKQEPQLEIPDMVLLSKFSEKSGINTRILRYKIVKGEIKATKIGKRWYLTMDEAKRIVGFQQLSS